MPATQTGYEHIAIREDGSPIIKGTTTKVVELIVEKMAYGWSPEEMHFQHPYLSLGQIHSALAYYWDHAEEMDRQIERDSQRVEELRQRAPDSPLLQRLRSLGQIK
ncbi:MAG: DUF433 domain-containing protein [Candidatus Sumerlaeota bacterium]|nr:DUF433 domain-containing protein [Candidatus Sumerlaeota bacterium]